MPAPSSSVPIASARPPRAGSPSREEALPRAGTRRAAAPSRVDREHGAAAAVVPARVADQVLADHVSLSYAARPVLADVSLTVPRGSRVALIGENGVGKSTLLRVLAGVEAADRGSVARPERTGFLWQEVRFEPRDTLRTLIESALAEVRAVEHDLEAAGEALGRASDHRELEAASIAYDAALAAAERADVWDADARRDRVLSGLGVQGIPLDRTLGEVSGGQRSRFAIAALLLSRPDALLLDEPTNHLDDDAVEFLQRQLLEWNGPVLFASHDRMFLDAVATALIDLDPSHASTVSTSVSGGAVAPSPGGGRTVQASGNGASLYGRPSTGEGAYTAYLVHKAAERERWERRYRDEQGELRRLRQSAAVGARSTHGPRAPRDNDKFIGAFKAQRVDAQIVRRVRDAQSRVAELERTQVRKPPALLRFAGIPSGSHAPESPAGTLIQVANARCRTACTSGCCVWIPRRACWSPGRTAPGSRRSSDCSRGPSCPARDPSPVEGDCASACWSRTCASRTGMRRLVPCTGSPLASVVRNSCRWPRSA